MRYLVPVCNVNVLAFACKLSVVWLIVKLWIQIARLTHILSLVDWSESMMVSKSSISICCLYAYNVSHPPANSSEVPNASLNVIIYRLSSCGTPETTSRSCVNTTSAVTSPSARVLSASTAATRSVCASACVAKVSNGIVANDAYGKVQYSY